ncbi:MAG TPA: glycosyltransferase family 2 protein [Candidatus Saccharimonadales bacterium]|nr:glycosyltransferase family 2 protein [Candidatus Saccharimonadales bacterium]
MTQPLVSLVIPAFNEALNLPPLYQAVRRSLEELPTYRFEIIFINDGSSDNSSEVLHHLAKMDRRIRLIEFARNFGKEAAVSAGLHATEGDAAIIMDADLQMPPHLLGLFIEQWRKGAEVVVGIFATRNMSTWHRLGSQWFYRIMGMIGHTKITPHATDYRLMDRQVIDVFNKFTERNRIIRGLIDWAGFKRAYIPFEQAPRQNGKPTYGFRKLFGLAIDSFTTHSLFPLKFAGYLGISILALSAPAGLSMVIERFVLHDPLHIGISGTAFLAVLIIFLVGMVLACLGLISLYIAHIHTEVINRPLYIVRQIKQANEQEVPEEAEA